MDGCQRIALDVRHWTSKDLIAGRRPSMDINGHQWVFDRQKNRGRSCKKQIGFIAHQASGVFVLSTFILIDLNGMQAPFFQRF